MTPYLDAGDLIMIQRHGTDYSEHDTYTVLRRYTSIVGKEDSMRYDVAKHPNKKSRSGYVCHSDLDNNEIVSYKRMPKTSLPEELFTI